MNSKIINRKQPFHKNYISKPFTPVGSIFEGRKFGICQKPTKLYDLFKNFKYIEIVLIGGVYWISFRGLYIADIVNRELTLTPGIFLHQEKNVFRTFNLLLRTFTDEGLFIKFINKKWVLCKEEEENVCTD